jgi:hypothetical protein
MEWLALTDIERTSDSKVFVSYDRVSPMTRFDALSSLLDLGLLVPDT